MASEQKPQGQSPGQSTETDADRRENEAAQRVESPLQVARAVLAAAIDDARAAIVEEIE